MALRVLVLVTLVGVAVSESVSHVSISFDGQEPVSYQVRPHAHTDAHRPTDNPRKRPKTPSSTTPPRTPARVPYFPKGVTQPPTTTTHAPATHRPRSEHSTPRPTPDTASHAPQTTEAPTEHSRPPTKQPSPPHPPPPYRTTPSHAAAPYYSLTHASPYNYAPPYHLPAAPRYPPSYGPTPIPPYHPQHEVPACAKLTNTTYCIEDEDYPEYEIKRAIQYHLDKFNHLYADVADLNTELSVERPDTLDEETYLCPSVIAYVKPLRAKNTEGKWQVVINNVDVHYETVTQTARLEECQSHAECPKVPRCYESKCLQKSIYHRFLVYDPYDQYFPFAVETFKLPASCACLLGASTLDH